MALTYGFFNSLRGDRKYDAEQMSSIFDGILKDGIIPSYGQIFDVNTASNGMQITVGTGRAWFNHTWTLNDSVMILTVPQSDITRPRYDAVVLEVNHEQNIRANSIKIVSGVAAVNASKPILVNTDKVKQYPLAYILVKAGAEEIKAEDIENMVGRTPTVFATGILETAALDDLWSQWEGEWKTWFAGIKLQLSGDIVTNLQYQIEELRDSIKPTKATLEILELLANATPSEVMENLAIRMELVMIKKAVIYVTLLDSHGNPIPSVLVSGLQNKQGESAEIESDKNGRVFGYAQDGSVTIKVQNYADIVDASVTFNVQQGNFYNQTITLETRNYLQLKASKSVRFSGNVKSIDYSLVGAGGGGGGSASTAIGFAAYSGGGGGYAVKQENVSNFSINTLYQASVGTSTTSAGYSGTTTFMGKSAKGGQNGQDIFYPNHPEGNGTGGIGDYSNNTSSVACNGGSGTGTWYSSFTEESSAGGGGGGGAYSAYSARTDITVNGKAGKGGDPCGGSGGSASADSSGSHSATAGSSGRFPGGGAGGSGAATYQNYNGSGGTSRRDGVPGGSGVVAIRMHLRA